MTDLSLRMPNRRLRAVLNLGRKNAAAITLPPRFAAPELYADWDAEEGFSALYVEFADGQLHMELADGRAEHHFHGLDSEHGEHEERSPWPDTDTALLVSWATLLLADFHALMPNLLDDLAQAEAWLDAGYDLYVCEAIEPTQLDLIEVEVEGALMTLPWLGAGTVANDHIDGDNHPIALFWTPTGDEPDQPIARAWLDPHTGVPASEVHPGTDWVQVGMPADEVLQWLEGIYLNHHVIPDATGTLMRAVLVRLGGLDRA